LGMAAEGFVEAVRRVFVIAAFISFAGVATSLVRGKAN
jgi:hypothetical protein